MEAMTTRIFNYGNIQAVRIPAELRLDTDSVRISRNEDGDLVLHPLRMQRGVALMQALRALPEDDSLCMSLVTWAELLKGAERSTRKADVLPRLEALARQVPVRYPSGPAIYRHYAEQATRLKDAGTPVGANDLWIACHALAEDSRNPVLQQEPWYALELPHVVAHQRETEAAGMAGDHLVVRTDRGSRTGQVRTYAAGVRGRECVEGQDVHPCGEALDVAQIALGGRGAFGAVDQLHHAHGRDRHLAMVAHEPLTGRRGPVLDHVDQDVGVE